MQCVQGRLVQSSPNYFGLLLSFQCGYRGNMNVSTVYLWTMDCVGSRLAITCVYLCVRSLTTLGLVISALAYMCVSVCQVSRYPGSSHLGSGLHVCICVSGICVTGLVISALAYMCVSVCQVSHYPGSSHLGSGLHVCICVSGICVSGLLLPWV